MDENNRLSPEEKQVNKIVKEATDNITKLENDIKKLENRGSLQLNYNPPGMPNIDHRQRLKDKEKLENQILDTKANTIKSTDKITHDLPPEQQKQLRDDTLKKLYPEVDQKKLESVGKEKKDISQSQEYLNQQKADAIREATQRNQEKAKPIERDSTSFGNSLNHSKFLSKEQNQQLQEKSKGVGKDDR